MITTGRTASPAPRSRILCWSASPITGARARSSTRWRSRSSPTDRPWLWACAPVPSTWRSAFPAVRSRTLTSWPSLRAAATLSRPCTWITTLRPSGTSACARPCATPLTSTPSSTLPPTATSRTCAARWRSATEWRAQAWALWQHCGSIPKTSNCAPTPSIPT